MGFQRLHPALRHAIVHDLGWPALRPVQEQAIDAVLDGSNAVVLAPTAGGKTEAGLFPVLSRILSEELAPIAAVYVCPIRALLNDLEPRVRHYARMVGLDAFMWHGDVARSKKVRFRDDPAHVLMTTPESLEVLLMRHGGEAARLFGGLGAVVVDEVHAFAGEDRGAHLVAVLERLTRLCGRDLQRVGLSATVGNPGEIAAWFRGSSARPGVVVDPPGPRPARAVEVDHVEDRHEAARRAAERGLGKKTLVFVESRSRAEQTAAVMADRGVDVFVHHSSVSAADRREAEAQFARGTNTAIVCTATLELGIDVGDLDQIVQVDAPRTVASFLQRIGRTGRRAGSVQQALVLATSPEALVQATAVVRLAGRGWVESVHPDRRAAHVLAHQVLALALQEDGISRHRLLDWLAAATPFAGLSGAEVQGLVETMVAREILHETGGLLSLGPRGERLFGGRNFLELYGVFTAPRMFLVLHGREEIGTLPAFFLFMEQAAQGLCFRLGGRAWVAEEVDWSRGVLRAVPAQDGRVPLWLGAPQFLGYELCQEIAALLAEAGPVEGLTPRAQAELGRLREDHAGLFGPGGHPLELGQDGVAWHTYAGGRVNHLLEAALTSLTGVRWRAGNFSVQARERPGPGHLEAALRRLPELDWDELARQIAPDLTRTPLSKFQPCLPPELEGELLAARLTDAPRAREVLPDLLARAGVAAGSARPGLPGPWDEPSTGQTGPDRDAGDEAVQDAEGAHGQGPGERDAAGPDLAKQGGAEPGAAALAGGAGAGEPPAAGPLPFPIAVFDALVATHDTGYGRVKTLLDGIERAVAFLVAAQLAVVRELHGTLATPEVLAIVDKHLGKPISMGTWLQLARQLAALLLPRATGSPRDPVRRAGRSLVTPKGSPSPLYLELDQVVALRNDLQHGVTIPDDLVAAKEPVVAAAWTRLRDALAPLAELDLVSSCKIHGFEQGERIRYALRLHQGPSLTFPVFQRTLTTRLRERWCYLLRADGRALELRPVVLCALDETTKRHEVFLARSLVLDEREKVRALSVTSDATVQAPGGG